MLEAVTTQLLGFTCILGILGLSGYGVLDTARSRSLDPAQGISETEWKTELASADSVLALVASQLERARTLSGTYDDTLDQSRFPAVRLVHADESSYCVELKRATYFRRGPGGTTAAGSC